MKNREHSDYYGADNAEQPHIRGPRFRPVFHIDQQGYACAVTHWLPPDAMTGAEWMASVRSMRDRYPLAHEDIVMPDGWTLNPDGSATQEVRDADGNTVARLTTDLIEVPQ